MSAFAVSRPLALAIIAASSGIQVYADEHCDEAARCSRYGMLEEIVVTGSRRQIAMLYSPVTLSLIDEERMDRFSGSDVAEAVRDVPGVQVSDAGVAGMRRIRIRGEDPYRVAILVDGQEITDHRGEGVPLTLDPSLVERVEIVKGAGSVLYGPRALGGVVNFITRKGGERPLQATVAIKGNTATDGEGYFASVYGSANDFDYRIAGTKTHQDNRETPAGTIENTSGNTDDSLLYVARHWGNQTVAVRYEDSRADARVFVEESVRFTFPFDDFAMDFPQRDREKLGVFYDWNDIGNVLEKIHFDAYRQISDRRLMTYTHQVTGIARTSWQDSELTTDGAVLQFDWLPAERHLLITGVQITRDDEQQDRLEVTFRPRPVPAYTTLTGFDKAELQSKALFVQDEWRATDKLTVTAGARRYQVDSELDATTRAGLDPARKDDGETIVSLAATYQLAENSVLRAGYHEGYMYPSLLQLSIGGVARTFVEPNSNLEPEKSSTYEVGWRYQDSALQWDLTLFETRARDYIDHTPCAGLPCFNPADRIYINIGKATTRGIEGRVDWQFAPAWAGYTAFAVTDRKNEYATFSTDKTSVPALSGAVGVTLETGYRGADFWMDAYLRGESTTDIVNADRSTRHDGGWVTSNIEFGATLGSEPRYQLSVGLKNIADKQYRTSTENLYAPGRAVEARFAVEF
jgi:hemoglobin/transferrin/lactoferrin receptor protein